MGDEYIESYYFCDTCGVHTVEVYYDRFLGEGAAFIKGPLSKAEGDKKVRLIGACPELWNKERRCNAHRTYFEESPDWPQTPPASAMRATSDYEALL